MYHPNVRSGKIPLKGKNARNVCYVFALVNSRRIAVLKNYVTKILVIIALVYVLSVWYPINDISLILTVLNIIFTMTIDTETPKESKVPP